MNYQQLKDRNRERINNFPMGFAFSTEQLVDVTAKLGPLDTLVSIGGGGFIRKADIGAFDQMWSLFDAELETLKQDDDLLRDALAYELGNHEFCITYDPSDAFRVLGLDADCPRVQRIYYQAKERYLQGCGY